MKLNQEIMLLREASHAAGMLYAILTDTQQRLDLADPLRLTLRLWIETIQALAHNIYEARVELLHKIPSPEILNIDFTP